MLGNYIGTDATGSKAVSNALAGVRIQGTANTIGGTISGSGNIISGNGTARRVAGGNQWQRDGQRGSG